MAEIGTDIEKAARLLQAGELVAIPTETVYGLAGNALDPKVLVKIFEAKNRPRFNPLIVHTTGLGRVTDLVTDLPGVAARLADAFWPGPLTLLLEKNEKLPDLLTAGYSRVAVRVPNHEQTLSLLYEIHFPLAAPSANPFGYISPTTPAHVQEQLGNNIPYILDGGPCEVGIESTIVGFEDEEVVIYRLGGLKLEDIERVAGTARLSIESNETPKASGQLVTHYAPATPLMVGELESLLLANEGKKLGILAYCEPIAGIPESDQQVLSAKDDLREAAQNLFGALRTLDAGGYDAILAELVPEEGLGLAINDRIHRAAK